MAMTCLLNDLFTVPYVLSWICYCLFLARIFESVGVKDPISNAPFSSDIYEMAAVIDPAYSVKCLSDEDIVIKIWTMMVDAANSGNTFC